MILVILDDLLFTSKIRATASRIGRTVAFARSMDAALASMQTTRPALVILDLNNPRINALAIVGAMKADARLASVPLIAFGSHVNVDAMEDARRAGVDEVLARSAFTAQLPDILQRGSETVH